jgi:high affinity Mn2+ porin
MKGLCRGILGALVVLGSDLASAADSVDKAPLPAVRPPSIADWSGFTMGAHFGYATGRSRWSGTEPVAMVPALAGTIDLFEPYDLFKGTGSYFLGLQAGYNLVLPSRVLLGIEADLTTPNSIGGTRSFFTRAGVEQAFEDIVLLSGTARGRLGWVFDHWLPYVTAGFAWSYERLTVAPGELGISEPALLWRLGWAAGAGIEFPLSPAWTARVEYLYTSFGRDDVTFPIVGQRFESDLSTHAIRLGMNFRLGDDLGKSEIWTKGPSALELDRFAFHGQTTFTEQYAFPFRSPYIGSNSLTPNHGRETWDTTFYIGARLWEGAELWINPEIDQGFGLSGTFGVAAFPSAESYKVGSAYPYARLPRTFLRQTIDLGGETETVKGGLNQFAGKQSSDRVVITVGKFSVADVFDGNKYAHDPRTDFLNWALADTATFDYAADAWAFTYGLAVEWYRGDWTVRAGVFDLPQTPNSTILDPTFKQFQMIGEIEHRHAIAGLAGKVAVTGFLNRARLGRFDDALALAATTGTTPSTADVRRYTSKSGLSLTAEQQITGDVAVFARVGFDSPELETNAFTDADRTLAAGVSVSGRLWGRPDDTFGLAGIVDHISATRIAYLNAGGLTAIIGDGRLPNPGNEKIIETFYSLPVFSWRLALDYQLIDNPAYNRDRGPVSAVATRLHTQF